LPNHRTHGRPASEPPARGPLPETERTTAATDALLAVVGGFGAAAVAAFQEDPLRAGLWAWALACLGLAAAAGAIIHGFRPPSRWLGSLWGAVFVAIGLDVVLIPLAALNDLLGPGPIRWIAAIGGPLLLAGYLFAVRRRPRFSTVVPFEAGSGAVALVIYLMLAGKGVPPGAGWIAAGLAASLLAGGVQALFRGRVRLVWTFDHNGIFHLVQIAGIVLIVVGVIRG
jgi:hypothetical protein